ncbi:lipoprotein insertase outer membrane protein LolB [Variovorax sp. J2P1-59]|uniref:lipoprotein insertase outer membrane protein LolB n=1 Tax=Variovorax flavidus TaxID=3053501 RepID=UPI00257556D7|nr:lipoprotein insertase outer membrane protein LolB [Variovorax sp. J2P1-59]MDM0077143.1 lipoprotein insertase outer membrane protein LolB [Variovorax sp. J2P1-59]
MLAAGCASTGSPTRPIGADAVEAWSGRLSLRVDSQPVQTFSALFELRGAPQAGDLTLTSPIGSTLAQLHWAPGEALLKNGRETRRFDSVDALIEAATGAAIPVGALFAWLAGRDERVPGWRPDLSQVGTGRLQATRESPEPRADLRIVFERA